MKTQHTPRFRPILFNTEMATAILEGRKTQTRRGIKPEIKEKPYNKLEFKGRELTKSSLLNHCAYGSIGDILWVRETTCQVLRDHAHDLLEGCRRGQSLTVYKTDSHDDWMIYAKEKYGYGWKPSIFMPKEACRLFLKIKSIRVERLQEISEDDAIAEGVEVIGLSEQRVPVYNNYIIPRRIGTTNPILSFQTLWESINGIGSWSSNPWAWVIEFEQIDKPENFGV